LPFYLRKEVVSLDLGAVFHIEWNIAFFLAMLNIVFFDLISSGDNAVLIAMAVRGLPKDQRRKGILLVPAPPFCCGLP
jgi:predicted tellurium resistance membrane protein TerC